MVIYTGDVKSCWIIRRSASLLGEGIGRPGSIHWKGVVGDGVVPCQLEGGTNSAQTPESGFERGWFKPCHVNALMGAFDRIENLAAVSSVWFLKPDNGMMERRSWRPRRS